MTKAEEKESQEVENLRNQIANLQFQMSLNDNSSYRMQKLIVLQRQAQALEKIVELLESSDSEEE